MIISARQTHAYMGQEPYHQPTPFPSNTEIPENADPSKYDGLPDEVFCDKCKKPVLIGNPDHVDNANIQNYSCPTCNGRLSIRTRDKSWSSAGMTPDTLNEGLGSSTNNSSQGVEYHPGANSNQDTFSSNLGRGDGSYAQ